MILRHPHRDKTSQTPNLERDVAGGPRMHPSILLLSHAYFVEVVPVADDSASGCLCVGFVEDYRVCLLRGFTRRCVQI